MSRWFRHYAGMCRDDKLVRASLRSKQSIERVVWIYSAVLESAAEIDDGGRYEVEAAEIAHFLRCKEAIVEKVLEALTDLGRIDGQTVTAWSKRQYKSDRSNARVAKHRANAKRDGNDDETLHVTGDVTLQERDRNSPDNRDRDRVLLSKDNSADQLFPEAPEQAKPADADKQFWDTAKAYLTSAGVKNAGAVVGAWVRDHGKARTAEALTKAQLERAIEPIPFVQGCFRASKASEQPVVPL